MIDTCKRLREGRLPRHASPVQRRHHSTICGRDHRQDDSDPATANNEIGVIQPIARRGAIAMRRILFHTDVQAVAIFST